VGCGVYVYNYLTTNRSHKDTKDTEVILVLGTKSKEEGVADFQEEGAVRLQEIDVL
jgi:hypothetical protein